MNPKCWLIVDHTGRAAAFAAQFARLRGLAIQCCARAAEIPAGSGGDSRLIAASFGTLQQMDWRERDKLCALVNNGATLYLRGGLADGSRCDLASLAAVSFTAGTATDAASSEFTGHELIPSVLRNESAAHHGPIRFAADISGAPEPILWASHGGGARSVVAFACRSGNGVIICDLQPDDSPGDTPIVVRLADPDQRCANAVALFAADCAAGRDPSAKPSFSLIIDDIPRGYDYFNEAILEKFFEHIERKCAGVHLDCGWIPSNQRMSRRYVEILKHHRAGFVWHGLHQHVNHQALEKPAAAMEAGADAVNTIERRYGVRFQPVMVFPYERADAACERILLKEGFLAGAEQPRDDQRCTGTVEYLRFSTPGCVHQSGLHFLHRYDAKFLTRDRVLAMTTMGLPILGFAHPRDVRLRRFQRFIDRGGNFSYFDTILEFAAAKQMVSKSFEENAHDILGDRRDPLTEQECA